VKVVKISMENHYKSRAELFDELNELQQQMQQLEQQLAELRSAEKKELHNRQEGADPHQLLATAIGNILNASTEEMLFSTLCDTLTQILECDRTAVFLYNSTSQSLTCQFSNRLSPQLISQVEQFFAILPINRAITENTTIVIADVANAPAIEQIRGQMLFDGIHSYTILPLAVANQTIGVVAAYCNQQTPFQPEALQDGQMVAHLGAAKLQNIRLVEDAKDAIMREQRLNDMTRTLSNALDLPTILQNVGRLTAELIGADAALLGLVIDGEIMIFYPHNISANMSLRPALKGRGVAWEIVETQQTICIDNYMTHPHAQPKWERIGIKAFLGVPIQSGDECLGAINLFNLSSGFSFSQRDRALAESVGRQAGVAIQNARMFAETKQRATALANALNRQEELDGLKNQFIQTVSHELRSPLGIIFGHAELLESGDMGELAPLQKESIQIIVGRVRMLTDLVDDLTALLAAETQEFRREKIDPVQLVYSMLAEYRMQADKLEIRLESEIAERLPMMHGDLTHLRRVFDNLMSNAFKFTPGNGRITIRMFQHENQIVVEIEDTGEGIDEDQLPRIFERFYQVKDKGNQPRRKGTGLGLALVKEIIEAHRGTVSVKSKPGDGTTFRIELPGYSPE
jgi:signal transduction histidine kinase